jgi:hypothetical protein
MDLLHLSTSERGIDTSDNAVSPNDLMAEAKAAASVLGLTSVCSVYAMLILFFAFQICFPLSQFLLSLSLSIFDGVLMCLVFLRARPHVIAHLTCRLEDGTWSLQLAQSPSPKCALLLPLSVVTLVQQQWRRQARCSLWQQRPWLCATFGSPPLCLHLLAAPCQWQLLVQWP